MITLKPGANTSLSKEHISTSVKYTPIQGIEIDISAFLLTSSGKVRGDNDMCFYGQPKIHRNTVQITKSSTGQCDFNINLNEIESAIEKIALTATIYENQTIFDTCKSISIRVSDDIEAVIPTNGMQETALILGEFYRHNGAWKFRCVAQGFSGGLEPLAKYFGVDITPTQPNNSQSNYNPNPAQQKASINLNKISLDKKQSSISLEKQDGNFGEIKVNLNWNHIKQENGFFGFGKTKNIDLDVGCLFELKNGYRGAVQALGNSFGNFQNEPFIELMGDDRTGNSSDGEWLRINGNRWSDVKRILVFAFIYEGAPNWNSTDGVVTLYVPGQPPIEVRMNEEGGKQSMCAIAMLENINGSVRVNREVRFFTGHERMDRAYNWGMNWRAGSK